MNRSFAILGVLCCFLVLPVAADQQWRSSSEQATLLELYTSEGCSSCPPADRWLSGLLDDPALWHSLFPVALHVDYWNDLGWQDRFARSEFSTRQRNYRREGRSNGVYTPGVQAAGWEWRGWRKGATVPTTGRETGNLHLILDGSEFKAEFEPVDEANPSRAELHVALLGVGVNSRVKAGENRGKLLQHDFVVLGYQVFGGDDLNWSGSLPAFSGAVEPQRWALVAWVSPSDRQDPLQVVGGWMTPEPAL